MSDTVETMAEEFKIAYPLTYDAIYNKGRADMIDEIIKLVDDELTTEIGMDLFVNRDLICERLEKLKEQNGK